MAFSAMVELKIMNINEKFPMFARFTLFFLLREIDFHRHHLEWLFSLSKKFNSTLDVPFVTKIAEIISTLPSYLDKLALEKNFFDGNPIELKAFEIVEKALKLFCWLLE